MTVYLVHKRNRFVYPPDFGVIDEPVSFILIMVDPGYALVLPEYPDLPDNI